MAPEKKIIRKFLFLNFFTGGRRSNVVKEVERLKKNREERRAKQQGNTDPEIQ